MIMEMPHKKDFETSALYHAARRKWILADPIRAAKLKAQWTKAGEVQKSKMTPEKHALKKAYWRKRYAEKREIIAVKQKAYRAKNIEKIKAYWKREDVKKRGLEVKRKWMKSGKPTALAYREKRRAKGRAWNKKNKSYYREYRKKYLSENIQARIASNLRGRVYRAVKNGWKHYRLLDGLQCSVTDLMSHIQSKFQPGMAWNNYGEWELDHVLPCASFDLTKKQDQAACFHWSNLQPLWAKDNASKRDRLDWSPKKEIVP